MAMPPKDIQPADLWAQITAMPRAHRIVDFPRKNPDGTPMGRVAIVVLTQEEEMKCNAETGKFLRKFIKDNGGQIPSTTEQDYSFKNLHEMQAAIEILYRCCKDPEDINKNLFPTKESVKQLYKDEIAILIRHYARVQAELGPITSHMSQEEMDAWIDKLATGASSYPLDHLSSEGLTLLVMYMASRLYNSQKDKSSPIAEQNDIIEIE